MSAATSLPEDLILEVFLRLPRKPLARSKCVSKGLLSLMDSQTFKKRYDTFHYSVSDFAVVCIEYLHLLLSMDFHLLDDINSSNEKEVNIPLDGNYCFFAGCCNGIVCLMLSSSNIFMAEPRDNYYILFNPFNDTFKKVEKCHFLSLYSDCTVGFGYDYATDDYKIIIFELDDACIVNKETRIDVVYVYSMSIGSWRQVDLEFSPGYTHDVIGTCVDGAIHWVWKEDFKVCSSIAAFDLETESMRSIPLPKVEPAGNCWDLKNFGGRLYVCVWSPGSSTSVVWVMEEYGVENSWTPLFNIVNMIRPYGYFPTWDNARLLCLGPDLKSWLWLDTQDGSRKNIEIQTVQRLDCFEASYVESLICVRSPLRLECSD